MPRKRSSSSEQTTPTGSELRRSQVRQAQRVYHARRKEAFHNLEERVRFLEQTVQDMSTVMISLNDALVSSPTFRHQPELVRQLENALRQTLASASTVHPSGGDASTAPTPAPQGVSQVSAESSRPRVSDHTRNVLRPFGDRESVDTGLGTLERRTLSMANSSIPIHSSISITIKHPMAGLMFPFFEEWSAFGLRLYWSTLTFAYTAVADRKSAVASEIFRYTLPTRSRETILSGLRRLLDFKATTPTRPDGTIILTQRSLPAYADSGDDISSGHNDNETPEQLQRTMYSWMCDIEKLQNNITSAIQCSLTDSNQEWLRANEVESYLEARGARLLEDSSIVELPVNSISRGSSIPDIESMEPAEPLGATWEELEMAIMTSGPDDQSQLYAYADVDIDSTTSSMSAPAASSMNFDVAGLFSSAPATAPTYNPLSWNEPSALFSGGTPFSYNDYIMPTSQPQQAQPPVQPQAQRGRSERCTISMDDLIQAFTAIGVCVGAGARYPSRAIDATLDALAMGHGQMVY